MSKPFLSIILPVHNEERRLPPSLEKIDAFLKNQPYSAEVIVVENGSTDATLAAANAFLARMPYLRVIQESARGKGLAVKQGMLTAQGEYRIFCDIDFSMPVEEINKFFPPTLPDVDVAIASREAPGAVRYNEPGIRHFIGRGFNTLVRLLTLPDLQDTQCGFKCFRGEVAERIFPLQTFPGWIFDVEVLFIARRMGYRVVEVAIPWYYDAESKIRVFNDSAQMLLDLITIRLNGWRGVYDAATHRSR